ncbi:MAG: iron-containing alcohol dehydrogenase family protein [Cellulosilyticaceae bacterium]
MNNYTVNIPSYTIGVDAFCEIESICQAYGENIVLIGGETALHRVREKFERAIEGSILHKRDEIWYGGECSSQNIERVLAKLEGQPVDMIFGVGGGRALDTAKAVADKLGKPIFTIPTTAATCAATTKLSVVYNEHGVFETFYFYDVPPTHVFIDTEIIANAPAKYLRAGIGDTLAKHYECTFASSGKVLDHNSGLARAMSSMCVTPLLAHGEVALANCVQGQECFELEQVVLANIITTGYVSMLIEECYNGAVAHSVFYGLTMLPHIEESYLHGDVVGYGVLVQLMMDGHEDEVRKLYQFYKKVGIPTCLKDIEVVYEQEVLMPILENVMTQPDMEVLPYQVTAEMLFEAMGNIEKIGKNGEV